MKLFACSKLYINSKDYVFNHVVEVDENGKVQRYFPLKEEIRNTEWIGGIIVIKKSYAWHFSGIALSDFIYSEDLSGILLK